MTTETGKKPAPATALCKDCGLYPGSYDGRCWKCHDALVDGAPEDYAPESEDGPSEEGEKEDADDERGGSSAVASAKEDDGVPVSNVPDAPREAKPEPSHIRGDANVPFRPAVPGQDGRTPHQRRISEAMKALWARRRAAETVEREQGEAGTGEQEIRGPQANGAEGGTGASPVPLLTHSPALPQSGKGEEMKDKETCQVKGCTGKPVARGICRSHYDHWAHYKGKDDVVAQEVEKAMLPSRRGMRPGTIERTSAKEPSSEKPAPLRPTKSGKDDWPAPKHVPPEFRTLVYDAMVKTLEAVLGPKAARILILADGTALFSIAGCERVPESEGRVLILDTKARVSTGSMMVQEDGGEKASKTHAL